MNIELVLGLGCRSALAGVLTAAAVGKAFDPAGTRRAAAQLTLPGPVVSAAGWLVPAVEGALALGLIIIPRPASVAAGCLLFVLTLGLAATAESAASRSCGCFGALGSFKAGLPAIARNLGLLAAAVVSASAANPKPAQLVTAAVVAVTITVTVPVARAHAARPNSARPRSGQAGLADGSGITYLLVVEAGCAPCERLLAHLEGTLTGTEPLRIVARRERVRPPGARLPVPAAPAAVFDGLQLPVLPALVVVGPNGAPVRPVLGGIANVFAVLDAEVLPGSPPPGQQRDHRAAGCAPCAAKAE